MRVTINARFLNQPVTGVQRFARALVDELDKMPEAWGNLDLRLVGPRVAEPPVSFKNIKLEQKGALSGHAWEQFELPLYANCDVLLCLGNTAPALSLLLGGWVVAVVHDLSYLSFPGAYSAAFRTVYGAINPLIMRRAARVITVSNTARDAIVERYPGVKDRLVVIPNGGAPSSTVIDDTSPFDRPYVLYVGTLSKLKNFDAIIHVARRLFAERTDYLFVCVGDRTGIYQSASSSPEDLDPERFIMVGQVDDFSVLARYYQHADLFLFPSLSESSGLPPIEAMSFGCPVVASDIPALRERCGDAAVYCNPTDLEDVYAKVRTVLDDPALRKTLSERGRARATHFTWRNCASALLETLKMSAIY